MEGEEKTPLAEGLNVPVGLADAGGGSAYVTECGSGSLLKISVTSKKVESIATSLGAIRAVALMPDGQVAVLDGKHGVISLVDPRTGTVEEVARNLPVGYLPQPFVRSGGIASSSDGTLYVSADRENALYALKRPV